MLKSGREASIFRCASVRSCSETGAMRGVVNLEEKPSGRDNDSAGRLVSTLMLSAIKSLNTLADIE
jgi:hypothetical protein